MGRHCLKGGEGGGLRGGGGLLSTCWDLSPGPGGTLGKITIRNTEEAV